MADTSARTAIVTGASRGIGRAIAVALGALNYQVVINYNSNADAAEQAAAAVRDAGGEATIVQADIGSRADREKLVAHAVDSFGQINLLVNNAGVAPKVRADLLETGEDSYDFVLDTNLKGGFFLTQAVANQMISQRQNSADLFMAIVNINSISAYTSSVNRGEYCIAKAGLAMVTQLFADRLSEFGISVNEIRPGIIATDMTSAVTGKYDKLILEDGITPIRRWGQPEDIAKAVAAIAAGHFPFTTGDVFNVDGGFHMKRL